MGVRGGLTVRGARETRGQGGRGSEGDGESEGGTEIRDRFGGDGDSHTIPPAPLHTHHATNLVRHPSREEQEQSIVGLDVDGAVERGFGDVLLLGRCKRAVGVWGEAWWW